MMNEFIRKNKQLLVVIAGIALVLIGILAYRAYQFHITSITPNNKNYPSSLSVMKVHFNRSLDTAELNKRVSKNVKDVVSVNFDSAVTVSAKDSVLTITYARTPLAGAYEVTLHDIASADGSKITKKIPLTVKDIDYDKMTAEEKKLADVDVPIVDDEHDAEYPILAKLPYETDQYMVSYRFSHADPAPTLVITMKFFPPGNNAVPATAEEQAAYISELRTYRTAAVKWIESQGVSPNDYIMEYTEPEIQDEFPAGRGKYFDSGAGDSSNDETNQ